MAEFTFLEGLLTIFHYLPLPLKNFSWAIRRFELVNWVPVRRAILYLLYLKGDLFVRNNLCIITPKFSFYCLEITLYLGCNLRMFIFIEVIFVDVFPFSCVLVIRFQYNIGQGTSTECRINNIVTSFGREIESLFYALVVYFL